MSLCRRDLRKSAAARRAEREAEKDFEFVADGSRPQVLDSEMVDSLRAYGRKVRGRAFSAAEFDSWGKRCCCAGTIAVRFGSWSRALAAAGVARPRTNPYSNEVLMEHLETLWRRLGRAPGEPALRKYGMAAQTYAARWGSLRRACELLAAHKRGELSRADLLRGGIRAYRKPLKPSVRWQVLERGGHKCSACGATAADGAKLEVDHIVPVAKGGGDELGNLRVLCRECNRGKGGTAEPPEGDCAAEGRAG